MYELKKVGGNTYYIDCPSRMGIYNFSGNEVCLIDSGNDKDAGKKVLKILEEKGWILSSVINTHIHADHIGSNKLLHDRTGCRLLYAGFDDAFIEHTILNPTILWGGYPPHEIRENKFFIAQSSKAKRLNAENMPVGLEALPLDGHSASMTAFKTPDDIWFLGDCLTGLNIIEKYHVSYIYNVENYIESLKKVRALSGRLYIPAHAEPVEDIAPLADANLAKVYEIIETIREICAHPRCFEDILQLIFQKYKLRMDLNQYILVGATIRSYISYMHDLEYLRFFTEDCKIFWSAE